MIEETYAVLAAWDFSRTKRENLDELRARNFIGAGSLTWLRDVAKVVNRRFEPAGRDLPLTVLAKGSLPMAEWKPILLWHLTRDEFLVRDFLQNFLFPAYEAGASRVRVDECSVYLSGIGSRGGRTEHDWTDQTRKRVAAGLLKLAADFDLLRGGSLKEFVPYHLPERSFLYLLHAQREQGLNPGRILESPDWRMFLMRPADVEQELLRLHQFQRVNYQVAGSLVQLSLPCSTALDYAERMVA